MAEFGNNSIQSKLPSSLNLGKTGWDLHHWMFSTNMFSARKKGSLDKKFRQERSFNLKGDFSINALFKLSTPCSVWGLFKYLVMIFQPSLDSDFSPIDNSCGPDVSLDTKFGQIDLMAYFLCQVLHLTLHDILWHQKYSFIDTENSYFKRIISPQSDDCRVGSLRSRCQNWLL